MSSWEAATTLVLRVKKLVALRIIPNEFSRAQNRVRAAQNLGPDPRGCRCALPTVCFRLRPAVPLLPLKFQGGLTTMMSNCRSLSGAPRSVFSMSRASPTKSVRSMSGSKLSTSGGCGSGSSSRAPRYRPNAATRMAASLMSTPTICSWSTVRISSRSNRCLLARNLTSRRSASTKNTPDQHVRSRTVSFPVSPFITSYSTSCTTGSRV